MTLSHQIKRSLSERIGNKLMETHSLKFSSDHKLINFNVPKYLINNFDNLVRFKRVSRTSVLIHLMENYIRMEKQRMEDDNSLNLMIKDIEMRNKESLKHQMMDLRKEVENELEPPIVPMLSDTSWDDHFDEDENDPSGVGWLNGLGR